LSASLRWALLLDVNGLDVARLATCFDQREVVCGVEDVDLLAVVDEHACEGREISGVLAQLSG
jgi:hypothetical protein